MQHSTNRIISPILYLWDNDSDSNDDGDSDEASSSNTRDEYDADDICEEDAAGKTDDESENIVYRIGTPENETDYYSLSEQNS